MGLKLERSPVRDNVKSVVFENSQRLKCSFKISEIYFIGYPSKFIQLKFIANFYIKNLYFIIEFKVGAKSRKRQR